MPQCKKYREKAALLQAKEYPLDEAVDMLTKVSTSKFDGTAEVHIRLFVDTKQGDQQVRSAVTLPHGTGKKLRIAAIVPEDLAAEAKSAGAEKVGLEDLIADIEKGNLDFDIVVAVPSIMKSLGKVARILGQRGLMPNPKAGTVSDKPADVIKELLKGRIEIRMDKQGIIHSSFGKMSFGSQKLAENLRILLGAVKEARPATLKGDYIRTITIAPTMGPGVRVTLSSI